MSKNRINQNIFNSSSSFNLQLELETNPKFLQKITDNSPQILYIFNPITCTNIYVNRQCSNILGYTPEQFLEGGSQIFLDILHPDDLSLLSRNIDFWKTASDDDILSTDYRMRHQNGSWIWLRSKDVVFERDEKGGVIKILGTAQDITEQKIIEEALKESENRFQRFALASLAILYILVKNKEGMMRFEYLSPAFEEIHETSVTEAIRNPTLLCQQIHPEDIGNYLQAIEESMTTMQYFKHEWRIITPSGKIKWIKANSRPKKRSNGDVAWYGVVLDTTERKEAEIALKIAKEKAETATQAKSEFLANMSHEIRTPMHGVLSMAQLLARTNLTPQQQNILQTILESGDTLLTIINDILDFSKIQSGMLQLEKQTLNLEDLIKSICHLFRQQSIEKGVSIDYVFDSDIPPYILGDRTRLRQILFNLVGNALKFTDEGKIKIFVISNIINEQELEIRISIEDTGIGIKKESLGELFQSFTQADTSISRKYGGTGLGLAISHQLVSLMGGRIWVESNGNLGGNPPLDWEVSHFESKGSIFHFTFITETRFECELTEYNYYFSPPKQIKPKSELKILVAEDYQPNQMVIKYLLESLGYQADIVENGVEVLKILSEKSYDVILMDMQMPEMDGIATTKLIRESGDLNTYIIALTANVLEDDRQKCLEVGMNNFLSKPISFKKLQYLLENLP